MALVVPVQGVGVSRRKCMPRSNNSTFLSAFAACLPSGRRRRSSGLRRMDVKAIRLTSDIDFSDPDWKQRFQDEFEERFKPPHLGDVLDVKPRLTTFSLKNMGRKMSEGIASADERNDYVNEDDRALLKVIYYSSPTSAGAECIDPHCSWVELWVHRAGPRKQIYFEPGEVKAGIVTCGGLCPGLNDVIRQIVITLETYGVKNIVGIPYGYRGFFDEGLPEIQLSRIVVQNINLAGGSLLGVSRGGANVNDIVDSIQARGINMLFILGGNGTHAGANAIHNECRKRKMKVAVVCVPKTIDNDILLMDKTFGFDTAVEEAQRAINSAYIEDILTGNVIGCVSEQGSLHILVLSPYAGASSILTSGYSCCLQLSGIHFCSKGNHRNCYQEAKGVAASYNFRLLRANSSSSLKIKEARSAYHGIGLVKLMGRSSGFIAMHASLSSGQIDICLIPEVPFNLDGPYGVLNHLEHLLLTKGSAVICVAEGAGQANSLQFSSRSVVIHVPGDRVYTRRQTVCCLVAIHGSRRQGLYQTELLQKSNATDASGNIILGDIGVHLQQKIKKHFKDIGLPADVKYIDPTYMVRAVRANASDAILCTVLGQNAVHGAFAGFSGITVGICNTHYVYLPIPEVIAEPRQIDPNSRMWHRCLISTGQPDFT